MNVFSKLNHHCSNEALKSIIFTLVLLLMSSCSKDCSEGYKGTNCDEQITPSSITITRVVVQSFPSNISDGLSNNPDIAIKIYNNSNSYGPSNTYFEDAYYWNSYTFYPNFTMYNAFENTHIELYDYDFILGTIVDQDYMGGVQGNLYNNQNDFPTKVDFDYGSYEFDVYLSYTW